MTKRIFLHLDVAGHDGVPRLIEASKYIGEQGIRATITDPNDDPGTIPPYCDGISDFVWFRALHAGDFFPHNTMGPRTPGRVRWLDFEFETDAEAVIFKLRFGEWLFDVNDRIKLASELFEAEALKHMKDHFDDLAKSLRQIGDDPVMYLKRVLADLEARS